MALTSKVQEFTRGLFVYQSHLLSQTRTAVFFGLLSAFGAELFIVLFGQIIKQGEPLIALATDFAVSISFVFIVVLLYSAYVFFQFFHLVIRAGRWEIIGSIVAPAGLVVAVNYFYGAHLDISPLLSLLNWNAFAEVAYLVMGLVILLVVTILLRNTWGKYKTAQDSSNLEDDAPWENEQDLDIYDYYPNATHLKDVVLKSSNKKSWVFGVEGPWGSGKTSFTNMILNEIKKDKKVTVIHFNPWFYDSHANLIKRFFDTVRTGLGKRYFAPELSRLFDELQKAITESASSVFPALRIGSREILRPVNETHEEISNYLSALQKPIIIVIDDIDRMPLEKAVQIFQLVTLCADFPFVKYILCYDLDNLYSDNQPSHTVTKSESGQKQHQPGFNGGNDANPPSVTTFHYSDANSIREFLEKVVNVRYLVPFYLTEPLQEHLAVATFKALQKTQHSTGNINRVTERDVRELMSDLFRNERFLMRHYLYSPRQLKLVVNALNAAKPADGRFLLHRYNVHLRHLILILLLKVNHPRIYADICWYEYYDSLWGFRTGGFNFIEKESLTHSYDEEKEPFLRYVQENNIQKPASDLLTKLFGTRNSYFDKNIKREGLLQSIKFLEGVEETSVHETYFKSGVKVISEKLKSTEATNFFGELNNWLKMDGHKSEMERQEKVWQIMQHLVRNVYDLNRIDDSLANKIIIELIENTSHFPHYHSKNASPIREIIPQTILSLLNDGVWNKRGGGENRTENLAVIPFYLFGVNQPQDPKQAEVPEKLRDGIVKLLMENRGALGVYDGVQILYFARTSNYWDMHRSLVWYDVTQVKKGVATEDVINSVDKNKALEQMSLRVFGYFDANYIKKNKNIISEIEELGLEVLLGAQICSNENWKNLVTEEDSVKETLAQLKGDIFGRIFWVFVSKEVAGKYAYKGITIKEAMLDYVFGHCFVPESDSDEKPLMLFVDFLFRNIGVTHSSTQKEPILSFKAKELDDVFGGRLLKYWNEYRDKLVKLEGRERAVSCEYYDAYYDDRDGKGSFLRNSNPERPAIFEELDKL